MLSYQHGFHAGNLADVHKHSALSWVLEYMTRKDKPLSYLESHGGRGLYDLESDEAAKTGEAAHGIGAVEDYPGSPWIASHLLREQDVLHVAELHPLEHTILQDVVPGAHIHRQDGFEMAYSICPPMPRRGLMLIDPSYEVKDEYLAMPRHVRGMLRALKAALPQAINHEVRFPAARDGHRMVGSGLFVVNPPWGLEQELETTGAHFAQL